MDVRTNRGKLAAAAVVTILFTALLALVLPALKSARYSGPGQNGHRGYAAALEGETDTLGRASVAQRRAMDVRKQISGAPEVPIVRQPGVTPAIVRSFDATIEITPSLSVGTAAPESIYTLDFKATIMAESEPDTELSEIALPIPPEVVSLSDLEFKTNGDRSEAFSLRDGYLVLTGRFGAGNPVRLDVTYSAVGKGIFILSRPAGRVVDLFKATLITHRSDIRMLDLSLQPNEVTQDAGATTYKWEYPRLVVARPIRIDVLGISATDMLWRLTWTGPISVAAFAILYLLMAFAAGPERFSAWTVVLVVGCFTAAFPLMYFMQEFGSLTFAVTAAVAVVTAIILARTATLLGLRAAIVAGAFLPVALALLAVGAAVSERLAVRGTFLTVEALAFLVLSMIYLPAAKAAFASDEAAQEISQ